jgi:hypothetical protein
LCDVEALIGFSYDVPSLEIVQNSTKFAQS